MTKRRPFQFSIAMLLALTGLAAITTFALTSEPETALTGAVVATLLPTFPALSITGCVNTKGYGKAFWIGATSVSSAVGFICSLPILGHGDISMAFHNANRYRSALAFWWGLIIPIGFLCVGLRWLLLRGAETESDEHEL